MTKDSQNGHVVDRDKLPPDFPTHRHSAQFWEQLGRAVATFGFLEETLGKAIFALTATRSYAASEIDEVYAKWLPTLERALYDPLGGLIDNFEKALCMHDESRHQNPADLINELRAAAGLRNVLCHGSWRVPDSAGRSIPFFVRRDLMIFDTPIDIAYLAQVQTHVVELIAEVVNAVTHMGWRFPGSAGPGKPVFET